VSGEIRVNLCLSAVENFAFSAFFRLHFIPARQVAVKKVFAVFEDEPSSLHFAEPRNEDEEE
jgi:hypothetical protein